MDESLAPMWLKTSLDCPEITLEAVVDLLGVLSGSAVEQTPVKNGRSTVNGFFRLEVKTARRNRTMSWNDWSRS